jgi:hypothetical protein
MGECRVVTTRSQTRIWTVGTSIVLQRVRLSCGHKNFAGACEILSGGVIQLSSDTCWIVKHLPCDALMAR